MGDNRVRGVIETNHYLRARVEELLDMGMSYREIGRVTGLGYRSVGRWGEKYERKVHHPLPPTPPHPLEVRLEKEFRQFEKIQTKANYDQYHATLREWEQVRKAVSQ